MSRLNDRLLIINGLEEFKNMFEERGVNHIRHFGTANFTYPDEDDILELQIDEHIWKRGDKLFKLAFTHYGASELWYIIAWFNKKPTEAHYKNGDVILIPKPVTTILNMFTSR